MSDFFDASGNRISDGLTARAADVNTLRDEVGAGFDLLPDVAKLDAGTVNYAVDTGAADAYVVAMPQTATSYVDGMLLVFKAANANTGAATVNVDALGVKALKQQDGSALSAGDIVADKISTFRYNATSGYFELQEKSRSTSSSVSGLQLASPSSDSVSIGVTSPGSGTSGTANIAIGSYAGGNQSGSSNISIGDRANQAVSGASGSRNIAIGAFAMGGGASTGAREKNICIGAFAGAGVQGSATGNVIIGDNSGLATQITTGSNNALLGYGVTPTSSSVSNEFTLGNSSVATLRCQVTSITSLSDARDKTDVAPLTTGLSTIMALNPVRFTWNMRDGGKVGVKDSGFIAQELQQVDDEWLRLVYAENPEKLEATYGRLIPVLVKAIQELKQEVDNLRAQLPG